MLERWSRRTQRAVDALMAWLYWHDIPKSQAFFVFNMAMALSTAVGTLIGIHIIPWWAVPVLALPGGFLAGYLVSRAYAERTEDRRAEERNGLTFRDVPAPPKFTFVIGGCVCAWSVWSLLSPHSIPWVLYFGTFWVSTKARSSPRYPKPPEKRVLVPAHSMG